MLKKRHIIIGSSAAGMSCASRLRALSPEDEIIIMSRDSSLPYNTCLLANYLADGEKAPVPHTKNSNFFQENNITLSLGTSVIKIEPSVQKITTDSGIQMQYDTLFLGLGSCAALPPIPHVRQAANIHFFHSLADAEQLKARVQSKTLKRAVIIGAGLTGVECADALATQGVAVYLIEQGPHILGKLTDPHGAALIAEKLHQNKITIYAQTQVKHISYESDVATSVTLSCGTSFTCDAIILATGSKPNTNLAAQAGCTIIDGCIDINEFGETSIPGIFAGGDCALVRDQITGGRTQSTLWPDAVQQGMYAAAAMAGQPKPYPGVCIITSSRFFGLTLVSCGPIATPPSGTQTITNQDVNSYHKYLLCEGKLIGFLQVGGPTNLGKLRRLLVNKQHITEQELA